MSPDIFSSLNEEQRQAVEHVQGPALVLAGAGSGKTRVLTVRIAHLVSTHRIPPSQIMAVTFTNKAAREMRERLEAMLGSDLKGMFVGTFHQFGVRMLRQHAPLAGWNRRFSILDAEQSLKVLKRVMEDLGYQVKGDKDLLNSVRGEISNAKNLLISAQRYHELYGNSGDALREAVLEIYPVYTAEMKAQNAFDFDDLLLRPVEIFEKHPEVLAGYYQRYRYLLVDEYQDTNRAQYRLIRLIADAHKNLMVVGDDDQSIYAWRGADIRNILDFEVDFPEAKVIRLEQNYRSTGNILHAANTVIRNNQGRKGKTLRTDNDQGEPLTLVALVDEIEESRFIADEIQSRMRRNRRLSYKDFAILYRTNAMSRTLEETFRRRGIPYRIVGGLGFYDRREIKDMLAYLRLIDNPEDYGSFERIVNWPKRGIGKTSVERLLVWSKERRVSPLEAAERADQIDSIPKGGKKKLQEFAAMMRRYQEYAGQVPVGELLQDLINELDVIQALVEEGEDGMDRVENVHALLTGGVEFDGREFVVDEDMDLAEMTELGLFLEHVSLITDLDQTDEQADALTMMTLHSSKGLEFPLVFIAGMEEGLFPHERSLANPLQMEEERRLFYVGITRAREKLYLTRARQRRRGYEYKYPEGSSFLKELPLDGLEEWAA